MLIFQPHFRVIFLFRLWFAMLRTRAIFRSALWSRRGFIIAGSDLKPNQHTRFPAVFVERARGGVWV